MKPSEYVRAAIATEAQVDEKMIERSSGPLILRLDHAAYGLCTEAGEFADAVKKHKFYGEPLDVINLREEIGDLLWYVAVACDAMGTTMEEIMERNIAKLLARYPGEAFEQEMAIDRDLEAERAELQGAWTGGKDE